MTLKVTLSSIIIKSEKLLHKTNNNHQFFYSLFRKNTSFSFQYLYIIPNAYLQVKRSHPYN